MKAKIIMLSALGAASFGLTQAASASCATDTDSVWECAQYQNGSTSYNNGPTGVWFGPSGDDTTEFTFSGTSTLNYGSIEATCTLSLDGQMLYDDVGNGIGVKVVSGSVVGGGLCSSIGVSGFPWYASDTTTFNTSSRFSGANSADIYPNNSDYAEGNVGNITVTLFGSPICTGYMPDVRFRNNSADGQPVSEPSRFIFNNTIAGTSCGVSGELTSQNLYDVNVW
ncbi:hypothetical protein [Alloalcanivorax xenomutans]|uniref:Uncharacterized protein n=1 Tax=Alloalcanivorax xenomutans TaxID=1094342 RepID=A0A9Q3W4J0_9GAMM|nr:hypothetical protein [Alloalcanivorax xenomutans]MCE7508414.1 hypothetical protein [Alloalcanivorax xenomutans]MCE7521876.1 hypothetical protein [Alloalcanivorax xenomutans]